MLCLSTVFPKSVEATDDADDRKTALTESYLSGLDKYDVSEIRSRWRSLRDRTSDASRDLRRFKRQLNMSKSDKAKWSHQITQAARDDIASRDPELWEERLARRSAQSSTTSKTGRRRSRSSLKPRSRAPKSTNTSRSTTRSKSRESTSRPSRSSRPTGTRSSSQAGSKSSRTSTSGGTASTVGPTFRPEARSAAASSAISAATQAPTLVSAAA